MSDEITIPGLSALVAWLKTLEALATDGAAVLTEVADEIGKLLSELSKV